MTKDCAEKCPCSEACPIGRAMEIIGGKWKLQILCSLLSDGTSRYGELKRKIKGITNTMLASSLKELETDGLVSRTQYNEMPLRVEYSITESAQTLMPILHQLAQWALNLE
jgi:Predicted transcriptional regulators